MPSVYVTRPEYVSLGRQNVLQGPSARPLSSSLSKSLDVGPNAVDAFPALLTAAKEAFGDVKVLFFTTNELAKRPGEFTSQLVIKVPNGPSQAFPRSWVSLSIFDARMSAAVMAIRSSALEYLSQWLPPRTFDLDRAKPMLKKHNLLVFDREKPTQVFNASMRLLGSGASQSWALFQLEGGFAVVLTVGLPSGRRVYGSPNPLVGPNLTFAKRVVLLRALEEGLLASIMADIAILELS